MHAASDHVQPRIIWPAFSWYSSLSAGNAWTSRRDDACALDAYCSDMSAKLAAVCERQCQIQDWRLCLWQRHGTLACNDASLQTCSEWNPIASTYSFHYEADSIIVYPAACRLSFLANVSPSVSRVLDSRRVRVPAKFPNLSFAHILSHGHLRHSSLSLAVHSGLLFLAHMFETVAKPAQMLEASPTIPCAALHAHAACCGGAKEGWYEAVLVLYRAELTSATTNAHEKCQNQQSLRLFVNGYDFLNAVKMLSTSNPVASGAAAYGTSEEALLQLLWALGK
eukprot:1825489-Pleurochrysis_carterae.AAC.20